MIGLVLLTSLLTQGPDRTAGNPPTVSDPAAVAADRQVAPATPREAAHDPDAVRYGDEVTVTASRASLRIGDAPSSTVTLTRSELDTATAPVLDDALRSIPGFMLFRRTGSRTANPTTQGVSLRGTGASGASRSVVLDDGIPLNDAFGGWVAWGRVAATALDRVEVVRGGASDLFGGSASSGAIQVIRRWEREALHVDAMAGSELTNRLSISAAAPAGPLALRIDAERFSTDGYVLVRPEDRGAIDVASGVTRDVVDVTGERLTEAGARTFVRVSRWAEERGNGTPEQTNETLQRWLAGGFDRAAGGGHASLRAFAETQEYRQSFTSISSDRASERLTRTQIIPARAWGASGSWARAATDRATLVLGGEVRRVEGRSDERVFTGMTPFDVSAGGTQRTAALFLESVVAAADRTTLVASGRFDRWTNGDASTRSAGIVTPLSQRTESAFSPRLAIIHRLPGAVALTASAYGAFRAPTLNELYRGFRVGNVVTNANDALGPERVRGYEAGIRWESGTAALRANAFSLTTRDSIANVTLDVTPSLITRQRQNVGRTRSRGIELDADWHVRPELALSAGWLLAEARVVDFDADRALEGRRLPQVPRAQGSLRAVWTQGRSTFAAEVRRSGAAWDDDLNSLALAPYTTIDLFASARAGRATLYAAIENAADAPIQASRTPVITLGQPRAWHLGVRFDR